MAENNDSPLMFVFSPIDSIKAIENNNIYWLKNSIVEKNKLSQKVISSFAMAHMS
jgi:hypothetical protein